MIWLAVEDADTHEVTDFECVTEKQMHYIMNGYRVDEHVTSCFLLQYVEDGRRVVYDVVTHKGGFGYNIWIANKYVKG